MNLVKQFFPDLTAEQLECYARLPDLYREWNEKINVISRQDIDNLEERHILHCLAIAKFIRFKSGSSVLDLGTGGGFPGIPLAIFFPEVQFTLIDGTGKKIRVVQEIVSALGLTNVDAVHVRVEDFARKGQFDFVVTRAVAPLNNLMDWSFQMLKKKHQHAYPNGVIALKGGDLREEIKALPGKGKGFTELHSIERYFNLPFFEGKYVVYVQG